MALSLATLAPPAIAADLLAGQTMEEAAPRFDWTGAYLGADLGYAWGDGGGEFTSGSRFDADPDGVIGGGYAGFSYQFANGIVAGVEADYAASGVEGEGRTVGADGTAFGFGNEGSVELDWSAAVRGRLGYAIDRVLPYVAAGAAWGKVNYEVRSDPLGTYSDGEDTYSGYTVGGGVDYAFTDNIVGRVEYRFTDFGDEDFDASALAAPIEVDLKTNDLRIGLAYKF